MPEKRIFDLLEFNKIKETVAQYTVSNRAREEILSSAPSFDKYEIETALNMTREASLMLEKYQLNPVAAFDDLDEILEKSKKDVTLAMGELLNVGRLLRSARIAQSTLKSAPNEINLLKNITENIFIDKSLEKKIFDCILSESEMSDNASDKLYGLRRKILNLNLKLKEKLLSYTRNNNSSKYLQDNLVTIREGRYVLPVKSECRGEVQGLVHDKSATGSTVFIEPFAIVELNNELKFAISEEQAEIEKILFEFSKQVAMRSDELFVAQNACTILDIVFCKAKYSIKIKGIFPEICNKKAIKFTEARHPLIDAHKVIPVNIETGENYRILIITGPNTGGKTVCLKTAGLFCLMAYFGLYLPCAKASLSIFDDIFCDIGDEQSIENELSTFSSHVNNLIYITQNMTADSLVLLDEVGGGTDPTEGAALAVGIVKYIEQIGSAAILTTHYDELKEYALTSPAAENACMQFDENTLSPTYKLITGMPGTSNALKIAKRLGLNLEIIRCATENLSAEKIRFENILQNAEKIKNQSIAELEETRKIKETTERERAQIEEKRLRLDAALEKIKNNAAAETKRLISSSMDRADEIIEEMKVEMQKADEAALLRAKKLRHELEDISYRINDEHRETICESLSEAEIKPGAIVIVKSLGASGTIKSVNIKKREAEIQIGMVKTNIAFSELGKPTPSREKNAPLPTKRAIQSKKESISSGFSEREIKVLGMTVSEAIEAIEPYILSMSNMDDAKILRIVHGKGTGALGKGIQAYLKSNPLIAEYRYGRYGEGDNGVTIATVK
ncbi:MAG: endonuclease MutS2 [Christensenellales bacterium]